LHLADPDSLAGAITALSLPGVAPGAQTLWNELIDPVWLNDEELLVLGGERFLRNIGPRPDVSARDLERTPRVDTVAYGTEFARLRFNGSGVQVTSLAVVSDVIAWHLDAADATMHYVVQRAAPGDLSAYRESVADTVFAMAVGGGASQVRYATSAGSTERALERIHGVASAGGRLFISRSWRLPDDVTPGPVPIGTDLSSDIVEVLADGSTRVVATAPQWRWGRLALSADGRTLIAESIERVLRQPLEETVWHSDLYRIDLTP
jgi:hypothetical protein